MFVKLNIFKNKNTQTHGLVIHLVQLSLHHLVYYIFKVSTTIMLSKEDVLDSFRLISRGGKTRMGKQMFIFNTLQIFLQILFRKNCWTFVNFLNAKIVGRCSVGASIVQGLLSVCNINTKDCHFYMGTVLKNINGWMSLTDIVGLDKGSHTRKILKHCDIIIM